MFWLPLTIVAAILWSFTNLMDSDLLERRRQNPNVLTFVTGVFGSLPVLLIPLFAIPAPSREVVFAALLAGGIGLFVYWPYYQALERTHTANVILLWNLAPVFVVCSTWFFLGEQLASREYIALILLVASSFLTSYQPTASQRIPLKAVAWMVLASVTTAVEYTLLGYVFERLPIMEGIAWVSVGVLVATVAIPVFVPAVRQQVTRAAASTRLRERFAINELLDLAANVLRQAAIRLGPVGLVSAVGGLQPLFVLLFGPLFKTKQSPPIRFVTVVAVFLGMMGLGLLAQDL